MKPWTKRRLHGSSKTIGLDAVELSKTTKKHHWKKEWMPWRDEKKGTVQNTLTDLTQKEITMVDEMLFR
jgi:hypothetical protein